MIYKPFINKSVPLLLILLSGCITGLAALPVEDGSYTAHFCDKVDCTALFLNLTSKASTVDCAFYHPSEAVSNAVLEKGRLVVDESHSYAGAIVESGSGLMHNKFCLIDNTVWTGSWNPNQKGKVPNNVVLIDSSTIAGAYRQEFEELTGGIFHGGKSEPGAAIVNGSLIKARFCPEDDCKGQVLNALDGAKRSIRFMTFSFTDDDIGDLLVEKAREGVEVRGIFDPRKNRYSEFDKLEDFSIVKAVHHKVFIIDERVVITGSYNPSRNGNERNDENLVIIHDEGLAERFIKEYEEVLTS